MMRKKRKGKEQRGTGRNEKEHRGTGRNKEEQGGTGKERCKIIVSCQY